MVLQLGIQHSPTTKTQHKKDLRIKTFKNLFSDSLGEKPYKFKMTTIKINVMSILAVLAIIFGAIALGLYEADRASGSEDNLDRDINESEMNMYEAGICLGLLFSLIVLIVTVCDKPDSLTGKTFLMFALAAILLLAGIICAIVVEATKGEEDKAAGDLRIASYCLAGAELLILIIGAIAPFIC